MSYREAENQSIGLDDLKSWRIGLTDIANRKQAVFQNSETQLLFCLFDKQIPHGSGRDA